MVSRHRVRPEDISVGKDNNKRHGMFQGPLITARTSTRSLIVVPMA